VLLDQLVVGHTLFVQGRFLLSQPRLCPLTLRLLLRYTGSAFGYFRFALAPVRLLAVLTHYAFTSLPELALTLLEPSTLASSWQ
jgi:hypothetical protein